MANVLLIEPDAVLARTYMQALQHAGHTVACAHDAQGAISASDETQPDIVVLELQMATHNGIEFLHEFRSYPEWQQIPVLVNTNIPPTTMIAAKAVLARDLGVVQCLYKPRTSLEQLLRVVKQQVNAA